MQFHNTLTFLLFTFFISPLPAQTGFPDITFGNGTGRVVTNLNTNRLCQAEHVLVQPDGKIIALGNIRNQPLASGIPDILIIRYNTNGKLDSTFAENGFIDDDFENGSDGISCGLLMSDGKILLGGYATHNGSSDFLVMRLNADGSRDSTFGTNGVVLTDIQTATDQINSIHLLPDGKIIACGSVRYSFQTNNSYALVRYMPDGLLDSTFADNGIFTNIAEQTGQGFHSVVLPDGKIITMGPINQFSQLKVAVFRHQPDGSYDTGFGTNGRIVTTLGSETYNYIYATKLQSDGKIVFTGTASETTGANHIIGRFDQDFQPDPTFGTNGLAKLAKASASDILVDLDFHTDGKINLTGCNYAGAKPLMMLYQLHPNGVRDSSFGVNGQVLTDFGQNQQCGYAVAVVGDSLLVSAGTSEKNTKLSIIVSRYVIKEPEVSSTKPAPDKIITEAYVSPNPVSSESILHFSLEKAQSLSIDLVDMQGRVVQQFRQHQLFESGEHIIYLPFDANLPAGMWLLRIQTEEEIATIKVLR